MASLNGGGNDVVSRISQATSSSPKTPLFNCAGLLMRICGPIFILAFYFLLSVHVYAHFSVVLFVLKKRLGVTFGLLWVAIGASLFYNVIYNHVFAMIVKPGGPKDLKRIEGMRKEIKKREGKRGLKMADSKDSHQASQSGNFVEDDRFEGMSKDVKSLLKYRNKTLSQLDAAAWIHTCSECNEVRPVRTRHCSVCNKCVFHADHHNPWINNCVGLENLRFYLLFVLYLLMGVAYNLFSIMSIWDHHIYKENQGMMNFLFTLDCLIAPVLISVNLWHWALAMTGVATVDVICGGKGMHSLKSPTGKKQRLTFRSIRDNLYRVFGTQSLIAIFSPSLRGMPFTGVEWTYQARDLGFMEEIESGEDEELAMNQTHSTEAHEGLELSDLSQSSLRKVSKHCAPQEEVFDRAHILEDSSLDSIMDDSNISI